MCCGSSIFLKKSSISTPNSTFESPLFLQIRTKFRGFGTYPFLSVPSYFWRKTGQLEVRFDYWKVERVENWKVEEVRFDIEFGDFLKNIEDSEEKIPEKIKRNSNFCHSFLPDLGGKNPAIPPCGSRPVWKACSKGRIVVSWYKNDHFFERFYTKNSRMDTPKKPKNWTKCPVTGHKTMVCHTLGCQVLREEKDEKRPAFGNAQGRVNGVSSAGPS